MSSPSLVITCAVYFKLAIVLLCVADSARTNNVQVPFVPKLCDVLFNSHAACPSPLFIKEDLMCLVVNNSLQGPPNHTVARINNSKNGKFFACQKFSSVTFTWIRGLKCIESKLKSNIQTKPIPESSLTTVPASVQHNRDLTLYQACEDGKLDVVKDILSNGLEDINCRGKWKRTPVMAAARNGREAVFDFLVSQGCDLSVVDKNNENVLLVACKGGNTEIVRKLIVNHNFDIESKGWLGKTPVMTAAFFGHTGIVDLLMRKNCNLSVVTIYKNNIFHMACLGGYVDLVKYCLSKGIGGIESRGFMGRTPVMMASEKGKRKVFDFLVRKGCDLAATDNRKNNILHVACIGGKLGMVKYIISKRLLNIESRGFLQKTPVTIAAEFGHQRLVKYFVHKGSNMSAVDRNGNNILILTCFAGYRDIVKYILSLEVVDINGRGFEGKTPVMAAAESGRMGIVDLLISNGCEVTAVDDFGNTVLHLACFGGQVEMVKHLISLRVVHGMETMRNRHGNTPVQMAEEMGHGAVVTFLKAGD